MATAAIDVRRHLHFDGGRYSRRRLRRFALPDGMDRGFVLLTTLMVLTFESSEKQQFPIVGDHLFECSPVAVICAFYLHDLHYGQTGVEWFFRNYLEFQSLRVQSRPLFFRTSGMKGITYTQVASIALWSLPTRYRPSIFP